jgi:glucosamine-6-phosphate deaminase
MRLIIEKDYDNVSKWTANYIAHAVSKAKPTADKPFVLGLPTGSTPIGTYRELVRLYKRGILSFEHVITFNMDEYIGLPADHPESYRTFMWKHLFSLVDIKKEHVNIPDGNAADLERECREYEQKIADAGGIDLFLGGVGSDGHIAFNEPGSSLGSRTRIKTLTYETIVANSRFFANDLDAVPKTALTVGIQTVMDAKEVIILVTGFTKAPALQHMVEGSVNHMWTGSILQMHPHGIIVCDESATLELKVKTVRYFKEIESKSIHPATQLAQN